MGHWYCLIKNVYFLPSLYVSNSCLILSTDAAGLRPISITLEMLIFCLAWWNVCLPRSLSSFDDLPVWLNVCVSCLMLSMLCLIKCWMMRHPVTCLSRLCLLVLAVCVCLPLCLLAILVFSRYAWVCSPCLSFLVELVSNVCSMVLFCRHADIFLSCLCLLAMLMFVGHAYFSNHAYVCSWCLLCLLAMLVFAGNAFVCLPSICLLTMHTVAYQPCFSLLVTLMFRWLCSPCLFAYSLWLVVLSPFFCLLSILAFAMFVVFACNAWYVWLQCLLFLLAMPVCLIARPNLLQCLLCLLTMSARYACVCWECLCLLTMDTFAYQPCLSLLATLICLFAMVSRVVTILLFAFHSCVCYVCCFCMQCLICLIVMPVIFTCHACVFDSKA